MIGGSCRPCSLPLSVKCEGLTAKLAFKANLTIPYNAKILTCSNLQYLQLNLQLIFLPGGVSFVWKEILIADSTPSCTEPLVYWVNSNGSVWVEVSRRLSVNPSSPQPSSWACCFTSRASPDLAPTNVTYFTPRPDLTPTAYRLNILGRQSESNSHSFPDLLIPSEQS